MSTSLAYAQPASRPARPDISPAPRPAPRPVERPARRTRPRATYAVITVVSLAIILTAQLLLSIAVSDGAYQITALQAEQKELVRQEEALAEKLDLLGSTQHLAANAAHLGMVPGSAPLFLDVSTGGVAAAPGTVDRYGCGGACNVVNNSLLTGMPLVSPQAPAATLETGTATTTPTPAVSAPEVTAPQGPVDVLPAPVTH